MTYDNYGDVGEFHQKFGLPVSNRANAGPREVPEELLQFRMKFMLEELMEFMEAAGYKITGDPWGNVDIVPLQSPGPKDHAGMFDALIDLAYVVFGTAHIEGYPWPKGWDTVQAANMAKVRAAKDGSDSKRGSSFDVVKPEGWTAPDIEGLLRGYGWYEPSAGEPEAAQEDHHGEEEQA